MQDIIPQQVEAFKAYMDYHWKTSLSQSDPDIPCVMGYLLQSTVKDLEEFSLSIDLEANVEYQTASISRSDGSQIISEIFFPSCLGGRHDSVNMTRFASWMVIDGFEVLSLEILLSISIRSIRLRCKIVKIIGRYESLLKGWILGSINQEVHNHVYNCSDPKVIWQKIVALYPANQSHSIAIDIRQLGVQANDNLNAELGKKLRIVALEWHWWKAKAILKKYKDAATNSISDNGNTLLHIVVREGHNYFVKELLNFIQDGTLIEEQNLNGETALHTAVIVDNIYAVELLVKKRKELLGILNNDSKVPLINLELCVKLLNKAISTKQYDLALMFLKIDPLLSLATRDDDVLMAITINFPSKLEFWEALMSLNEQSFVELPSSAQPESMRKTQPFSEAALIEDPEDKNLKKRRDKFEWIRSSTYLPEVKLS
ncbi:ankyrin repeat-containing protein [Tanacetum coccineum]|uniref:Ankyrin repeat-containing protein n=1 Tax=Tanacetum coccineum TaxID=301880 RepID=A0ABQ5FPV5_9ASTR